MLTSNLPDKDVSYKKGCFYSYVNRTFALFGSLPSEVVSLDSIH